MELKPIKEEKEILYPTAKEVINLDNINETTMAVTLQEMQKPVVCYVAVPSYMQKLDDCETTREFAIVFVICSFVLFFTNLIERTLYKNKEDAEKHIKKLNRKMIVEGIILIISIIAMIVTSIAIVIIKHKYNM